MRIFLAVQVLGATFFFSGFLGDVSLLRARQIGQTSLAGAASWSSAFFFRTKYEGFKTDFSGENESTMMIECIRCIFVGGCCAFVDIPNCCYLSCSFLSHIFDVENGEGLILERIYFNFTEIRLAKRSFKCVSGFLEYLSLTRSFASLS